MQSKKQKNQHCLGGGGGKGGNCIQDAQKSNFTASTLLLPIASLCLMSGEPKCSAALSQHEVTRVLVFHGMGYYSMRF